MSNGSNNELSVFVWTRTLAVRVTQNGLPGGTTDR
jgi:hypothetical protein